LICNEDGRKFNPAIPTAGFFVLNIPGSHQPDYYKLSLSKIGKISAFFGCNCRKAGINPFYIFTFAFRAGK